MYRYWEEGFPLQMEGANNHALVLVNDGRAMLAIGNYGPGDQPQVVEHATEGPTLAEYDAGQRGEWVAVETATEDAPTDVHETYTVTLRLDLETLNLQETVRAYNIEKNREELERVEPGVFVMIIRKHDFALILVE